MEGERETHRVLAEVKLEVSSIMKDMLLNGEVVGESKSFTCDGYTQEVVVGVTI